MGILPPPTLTLTKTDARRFLLAHHYLWPPRSLTGKAGILKFIRHVGCVQFDPIDVVGRNPDLVLQSRVADYCRPMLEELLYADHQLLDGWDKMAAIYPAADWPYFARHRARMVQQHGDPSSPSMAIAPAVLQAIRERGPLSSIDLDHAGTVDWFWGPTRLARASLEILYAMGEVTIHHRVGTRRFFELTERLLPADLLSAPDPNPTEQEYQNWHVLRRVGGLGLAKTGAGEYWYGILGVKTEARQAILARLVERGDLVAAAIEGVPNRAFFIRTADLSAVQAAQPRPLTEPQAAIVGVLDNIMWDRDLLRLVFDFDYVWEVYKPVAQRKYGYYVLPVIYGDRFVARFDPAFDKKTRELTIANWWWEEGIRPDEAMQAAILGCFRDFMRYLDANRLWLGAKAAEASFLLDLASASPRVL
ncbi:MAG: YcaQ family DNA glycosylase [Anaerolineae bacterium]|nr:YcaQ family DNA glycosylase [Anaerolineae bacterium]